MEKTFDHRMAPLATVLLEMTQGNFFHNLELSDRGDDIDAIKFLVNRVCEEVQDQLIYEAFIHTEDMSHALYPLIIIMDDLGRIEHVNEYAIKALDRTEDTLERIYFEDLLTKESKLNWHKKLKKIMEQRKQEAIVRLDIVIKDGILISKDFFVHVYEQDPEGSKKIMVNTLVFSPRHTLGKRKWIKKPNSMPQHSIKPYDVNLIREVDNYMSRNLQKGSPDIRELARLFGTNENKLNIGFRVTFNRSVLQQFQHKQLKAAKNLLLDSQLKIYEIAPKVGFTDHAYFSRFFKKETGESPIKFRTKDS